MAAQKFKRMRAFARFRNEIWCMDLAYVDKLAKENNGVKYLLVRQDIVRIHSLMIYSDLLEYNIVGDTKAPLLRCFPLNSKLKGGDIITTGQYMNYQTFSNLQFRHLLKNSFHSIHIDLRDTSGEKIPFVSVGLTRLVLMFRSVSSIHF